MIGSWRPLISMAIFSPSLLMVCWEAATDGVGLKPARTTISLPSLIPPKNTAGVVGQLDNGAVRIYMEGIVIGKPGSCADRETVSDFHAFTAPMETSAFARLASSFSNTGSPTPAGIW